MYIRVKYKYINWCIGRGTLQNSINSSDFGLVMDIIGAYTASLATNKLLTKKNYIEIK